jgi:hypothetical protein
VGGAQQNALAENWNTTGSRINFSESISRGEGGIEDTKYNISGF